MRNSYARANQSFIIKGFSNMPRGGARPGAGRKKGGHNRSDYLLKMQQAEDGKKLSSTELQRLMKKQVALCVADGMGADTIAVIMGIKVEELEACFARELKHGREIVRAEELMRLDAASADGKVSASKEILQTSGSEAGAGSVPGASPSRPASESATARALRILQGGKSG